MRLLNDRDRALANRLLRSEDLLLQICGSAHSSPGAVDQLIGGVSLLASLAYTLEHALAPSVPCDWPDASHDDVPVLLDYDDSDRWTLAKEPGHAVAG